MIMRKKFTLQGLLGKTYTRRTIIETKFCNSLSLKRKTTYY